MTEFYDRVPNVPLMRKLVEWVEWQEELPVENREWDQEVWRRPAVERSCGTAYCAAGYVCEQDPDTKWATDNEYSDYFDKVIANDEEIREGIADQENDGTWTVNAETRAARLLGISLREAPFSGGNTAGMIREQLEHVADERL